jgi:hypothetical protein
LTGRTKKNHENVIQDSNGSNQATPKYMSRVLAWPTAKKSNNFKYESIKLLVKEYMQASI